MDVYLVDGTYELFRHFFALPSATDGNAKKIAAVRGVLTSVLSMIEAGATHIGVATDQSGTARLWCRLLIVLAAMIVGAPGHAQSGSAPQARVIQLDAAGKDYLPILTGPPESVSMESGLVILAPNRTVGKHSTKEHEELLIVLEGEGQMIFSDGSTLPVKRNTALYCPPRTEHDVKNTGSVPLRYVYVAAEVR